MLRCYQNQYFQILDLKSPNLLNMDKLSLVVARMTQREKILEATTSIMSMMF